MNRLFTLMCLALFGVQVSVAAELAPGLATTECEVWERERTFAQSVENHDANSFAEHLHVNAVFGAASPNTQRGREAVIKAWAGIVGGEDIRLVWRPHFVSVGGDMNVAMSRGPFAIAARNDKGETTHSIGQFVSVWVRTAQASRWYVVLDGGGPPPTPATEDEVKKHLDSAPVNCPRR